MSRKKKTGRAAASAAETDAPPAPVAQAEAFPVVGIGASAGGLSALEAFFGGMPEGDLPGMAFIVVQHLSPDHKSLLAELVARHSRMPVSQIEDGMAVEPNRVYITPPNRDLGLREGRLRLSEPSSPRGHNLPVDSFFRSLAEDLKEHAICVVLSGTGSDGTLGLRAIKDVGGMAMAQRPETAGFDGMPRSAIDTGLVDSVLAPGDMPAQLVAYAKLAFGRPTPLAALAAAPAPGNEASPLLKLFSLVRAQTGHDFTQYKRNTVLRRVERRMAVHQLTRLSDYAALLEKNPAEVGALFQDFLIGVTHFFRDPDAFHLLETVAIPRLVGAASADGVLRVWVPGCSTGEEAYSIAMLVREQLDVLKRSTAVQVFATDIDARAIDLARAGRYPVTIAESLSKERLGRFFRADAQSGGFRVQKSIRDLLIFSTQDLVLDPPFSRLDLISCRNLLIYLAPELQKRLIPLFHYALKPGGLLFLGTAETVGDHADLFTPLKRDARIYRRLELDPGARALRAPRAPGSLALPHPSAMTSKTEPAAQPPLKALTEEALLQHFAAAAVVVRADGELLYLHGRTGQYLEPAPGEVRMNALQMAREGLQRELTTALHQSAASGVVVRRPALKVRTNGSFASVDVTVSPLPGAVDPRRYLIVFEAAAAAAPGSAPAPAEPTDKAGVDARIVSLTGELKARDEYLLSAHEEMQTANEELKSSNEELQSTNEEMQSTNEELETSKEELQSLNEELATVNAELQTKVADLSRVNNDMDNLLAATGIGTIYLDLQLRIQRFTPAVCRVINVIPSDRGRPVAHIVSNLPGYTTLVEDVRATLDTLVPRKVEVQAASGDWYLMGIRPYRTVENAIEGAVITFVNITDVKRVQDELAAARNLNRLAVVVRDSSDAIVVCDLAGTITAWNPAAERLYGWTEAEAMGMRNVDRLVDAQRKGQREVERGLVAAEAMSPRSAQRVTKNGTVIDIWATSSLLLSGDGKPWGIATTEARRSKAEGGADEQRLKT